MNDAIRRLGSALIGDAEARRRRRLEYAEERWRAREDWRDVRRPSTIFPGRWPTSGLGPTRRSPAVTV